MRKWVKWSLLGGFGLVVVLGVIVFQYLLLPIFLRKQIYKWYSIQNGTDSWDRFVNMPIPITMDIYFFHLDNPEGVLRGEKPKVREVGPYTYREYWKKVDVHIDEERDRIFYRQSIDFVFDQEKSGNLSDLDVVTIINPIIHAIADIVDGFPGLDLIEEALEFGLPELLGPRYGPVLNTPVRELLFTGTVVPCSRKNLSIAASFLCSALLHFQPLPNLQVTPNGDLLASIMNYKRRTPLFEMVRGIKEPEDIFRIVSMDGKKNLGSWWCDSANVVNGFDMGLLAPFVTKSSVLPMFVYDLHTTVRMVYQKDSEYAGIQSYRFVLSQDLLGDPRTNPATRCYCPGSALNLTVPAPCMDGAGVLDVSSSFGVPSIISLPHFYKGSEKYVQAIEGLHPDPKLHEPIADVEPTTGIPLVGKKRIQASVNAKKRPAIRLLRNHTEALIPMLWADESAEIGDDIIDMIKSKFLNIIYILNIVSWSVFSVGVLLFVIGVVLAVIRRKQEIMNER